MLHYSRWRHHWRYFSLVRPRTGATLGYCATGNRKSAAARDYSDRRILGLPEGCLRHLLLPTAYCLLPTAYCRGGCSSSAGHRILPDIQIDVIRVKNVIVIV